MRTVEPARVKPTVELLEYQREDVESDDRFRWNCWARQTGKSFAKSLRRILRGLHRGRNQIFLSAGLRQSRELMQKAVQHCAALKIAFEFCEGAQFDPYAPGKLEIRLPRGVRITALPANPMTVRGYTADVLLDEFAMHTEDREIWAAMLPSLLRDDGELDIASTPKGRSNIFYELQSNPLFATSYVTLPQAIAQGLIVNADEIRAASGDEELYRQEFLCEFLDEATAFLTHELISGCTDPALTIHHEVESLAGDERELFAGVDVGRKRDLTVIWVVAAGSQPASAGSKRTTADETHTLTTAAVVELSCTSFQEQAETLNTLMRFRNVRTCCIDAGGLGMQLAEELVQKFGPHRVLPVTLTAGLKSQIAGALRVAVEGRRIAIPADDRIREDWHSVERTVTEAGLFRLSAPRSRGSHADRFWAAALAVHAAEHSAGVVEHVSGKPMAFARKGAW